MKATRNKTIDLSVEEGQKYLNRCITLEQSAPLSSVLDKTILGDTFNTIPYLPKKFVDLLIVDPPYNLDKNFNGKQFKQLNDTDYEEYTKQWIQKVIPLLKDTASIYVCCDWNSSLIIGNILKQYFFFTETNHMAKRKRPRSNVQLEKRNGGYLVCNKIKKLYLSCRGCQNQKKSSCALPKKRQAERLGRNRKRKVSKYLSL